MRTTLTIDDDVLEAARSMARREGKSVGDVVSDLARRSLSQTPVLKTRNGIPQLPLSCPGAVVTTEHVKQLEDELP